MNTHAARHPKRLVAIVLGLTAVIALMLLAFATPAINSGPHEVPIAVSGPEQATAPITQMLEQQGQTFAPTTFGTAEEAAEAIVQREAVGGIAVSPQGVTIQTASGAGAPYTPLLTGIGDAMRAQGQQVTTVDLAPMTKNDPSGAGIMALGLPLIFGGMASAAALVLGYRGPVLHKVLTALALSLAAGYTATAILQLGFGSFAGSFWLTGLAVSAGIAAISLTALGLGAPIGMPGIGLAAALMLFVANPLSGMAAGPAWLPQPWGDLGQLLPIGAAGTAIRSAAFFEGHGAAAAWWVLAAWITCGLLLALAGSRRATNKHATV